MSKIVEAINAMIKNSYLIQNVAAITKYVNGKKLPTYYFKYKKYVWSIEYNSLINNIDGVYYLNYYPGFSEVEDLIKYVGKNGTIAITEENYIVYDSSTIKTLEADESFSELYRVVKGKLYNVENVLDDIIRDM